MQVVFHLGAHCTDEDRLLKSLLKNCATLKPHGVTIPGPGRYRKLIRTLLANSEGQPLTQAEIDTLHSRIVEDGQTKRLILSNANFMGFAAQIFAGRQLYQSAKQRLPALAALFPGCEIEFHLALRNPASFVPATFAQCKNMLFDDFIQRTELNSIRWSSLVHIIRAVCPEARLTVWCNEDTPLIWSQLLYELSGVDRQVKLEGQDDLLAEIMRPEGLKSYEHYITSHPLKTHLQHSRVISAFLDKFALADQLEDEVSVPGLTQEIVDQLSDNYEADLQDIEIIPGVNFIQP